MKTNIRSNLVIFSISLIKFSPVIAGAGGIGDGGGQAVVCRDNGKIISAELLDIYEAKNYFVRAVDYGHENEGYLKIAKDMAAKLDVALPSIDPTGVKTTTASHGSIAVGETETKSEYFLNAWLLYRQYKKPSTDFVDQAEYINFRKLLLPGDLSLPPVGDSTPRVIPTAPGCKIEQLALYSDGNSQVRFVEKIWNALSETDKAALIIHEVLYHHLRNFGDTNSDRTRLIVAHLFSDFSMASVVQDVPTTHLSCWAKSNSSGLPEFHFVVYPQDPKAQVHQWAVMQFVRWNGEIVMTETKVRAPMDYFAKAFNIPAMPSGDNVTVIQRLENSFLNPDKYALSKHTDDITKKVTLTFQAAYNKFDEANAFEIKCRKKLSKINLADDGYSEED